MRMEIRGFVHRKQPHNGLVLCIPFSILGGHLSFHIVEYGFAVGQIVLEYILKATPRRDNMPNGTAQWLEWATITIVLEN